MKLRALEQAIPKKSTCLLDTSFILTYFQGSELASEVAAYIVDNWLAAGRNAAVVSVITAMEATVRPMHSNNRIVLQSVMDFFRSFVNLQVLPIDLDCAFEAARVRAVANLAAPDALILAGGFLRGVEVIATNDRIWKSKVKTISSKAQVAYLEDFV